MSNFIDFKTLEQQARVSQKLVMEIKNQNRTFDNIIQEAVKGAPNEDKKKVEEFRLLSINAINLAKEGKIEEAQNLIKSFQDGN